MNRSALIGSVLLVGVLAACSSGASTSTAPSAGGTTSPAAPSTTATSSSEPASSTATTSPSGSSTAAAAPTITIKNFAFTVAGKISPGAKIMVHNEDSEVHTVTADQGSAFDVNVPGSGTVMLTAPSKLGSYKFHCNFHSNMHATLTVG